MFNKSLTLFFLLIILFTAICSQPVRAQVNDDDLYELFQEYLQNETFKISGFVQMRGTYAVDTDRGPGSNEFSVPQARVDVKGRTSDSFKYRIQMDVADEDIFLDAFLTYAYDPALRISFGAQKTGISAEFNLSPHTQDFTNRSLIVRALTQERQIGVRLDGDLGSNLHYSAGMFNGNQNKDNDYL